MRSQRLKLVLYVLWAMEIFKIFLEHYCALPIDQILGPPPHRLIAGNISAPSRCRLFGKWLRRARVRKQQHAKESQPEHDNHNKKCNNEYSLYCLHIAPTADAAGCLTVLADALIFEQSGCGRGYLRPHVTSIVLKAKLLKSKTGVETKSIAKSIPPRSLCGSIRLQAVLH